MRHRKDRERTGACVFTSTTISPNCRWTVSKNQEAFFCFKCALTFFLGCLNKKLFQKSQTGPTTLSSLSQNTSEKWLFAFACGKQQAKPQAQIPAFGQPLELCTQKTGLNRKCSEVRVQRKKSSKQASYSLTSVPACVLIYCVKHGLCICVDLFTTRLSFSFTWSVSREEPARVFDLFPSCDQ